MYQRNCKVSVALLECNSNTLATMREAGIGTKDLPRDTDAIEFHPHGAGQWLGVYLEVSGYRYDYGCVANQRVGGHGGPNAAGPCGHIGTADPNSWDSNNKATCTVCGAHGYWVVPHEFFFTRVMEDNDAD